MRRIAVLVTVASLVGCFTPAMAFWYVGDPIEGGSWGQRFEESGVGPFDYVRCDWVSGNMFRVPNVFLNFTSGSNWIPIHHSTQMADATGPARTTLQWDIYFQGSKSDPLSFKFAAYNGEDTWRESVLASWSGSRWSYVSLDQNEWDPGVAPEPSALLLLGAGLGVVGLVCRLRRP